MHVERVSLARACSAARFASAEHAALCAFPTSRSTTGRCKPVGSLVLFAFATATSITLTFLILSSFSISVTCSTMVTAKPVATFPSRLATGREIRSTR